MTEETGTAEVVEADEIETTDTEATAAEDDQNLEPETAESEEAEAGDEEAPEAKTFTQEQVDEMIQKRLARQERRSQRSANEAIERLNAKIEALTASTDGGSDDADGLETVSESPFPDDFYSTRDEVLDAVEDKYPEVDLELFGLLPVTNTMAEDITYSDKAPELVKYFTDNPKEAVRISKLPARKQTQEIGKLEGRVSEPTPKAKTTGAPAPVKPVKAKAATKPRYYEGMSDAEYNRKRREDIENRNNKVI